MTFSSTGRSSSVSQTNGGDLSTTRFQDQLQQITSLPTTGVRISGGSSTLMSSSFQLATSQAKRPKNQSNAVAEKSFSQANISAREIAQFVGTANAGNSTSPSVLQIQPKHHFQKIEGLNTSVQLSESDREELNWCEPMESSESTHSSRLQRVPPCNNSLRFYIERTRSSRETESSVFLTAVGKHHLL